MTAEPSPELAAALARLDRLINWERRDRGGLERTLEPVLALLQELANPHRSWKAVHVTGTKGKSSTSSLIERGLRNAGWRTGLYSSPHVDHVTERTRLDGTNAEDRDLAQALERALDARAKPGASLAETTYFDVLTAAGFELFARQGVDWGVIECGLGGRLDSTNAVESAVAVITNIGLEHTDVLGDTRAAIAREKVGILKQGSVLVTTVDPGDTEVWPVFVEAATERNAELVPVSTSGKTIRESNLALARATLDVLGQRGYVSRDGARLGSHLLSEGDALESALPGRMEILSVPGCQVVLDGAHVASSVSRVLDELEGQDSPMGLPVCVLALRTDKDLSALLKTLQGRVDRVLCTSLDSAPFRTASELEAAAKEIGLVATAIESPGEALHRALELASGGGWVLAIGSLYLAGALRQELGVA